MSAQPQRSLFDPGPADGGLTAHQQAVYEAVGVGITASEAGAIVHSRRAIHAAGGRCKFCRGDGNGVLQSLKKRGLVKRRRNGTWQLVRKPVEHIGGDIPY